jgi:Asp/Glu/hydantoin racemase
MARILFINPNSSEACSDGIAAAIAPFRYPGGPAIEVATLRQGPPAIYSWEDWFSVAAPLVARVRQEDADCFVIACASDPALPALREATRTPVLGIFSCAVLAALSRAETFGVVGIVSASKARHRLALRQLGIEARLADEIALDVSMQALLDPLAARAAMSEAACALVRAGAGVVVLGCAGMAHHRAAVEQACGVPVIEPCQAAAAAALGIVLAGQAHMMAEAAE